LAFEFQTAGNVLQQGKNGMRAIKRGSQKADARFLRFKSLPEQYPDALPGLS